MLPFQSQNGENRRNAYIYGRCGGFFILCRFYPFLSVFMPLRLSKRLSKFSPNFLTHAEDFVQRIAQACAARDTVDRLLVRIRFSESLALSIRRLTDGGKRLQIRFRTAARILDLLERFLLLRPVRLRAYALEEHRPVLLSSQYQLQDIKHRR